MCTFGEKAAQEKWLLTELGQTKLIDRFVWLSVVTHGPSVVKKILINWTLIQIGGTWGHR